MPVNVTSRQSLDSFQRAAELARDKPLELRDAGKENERLSHPKWPDRVIQFFRSIAEALQIRDPGPTRAQRQEAAKAALIRLLDSPASHPVADFISIRQRDGEVRLTGNDVLALLELARRTAVQEALRQPETLGDIYRGPKQAGGAPGAEDSGLRETGPAQHEDLPQEDADLAGKLPVGLRSVYEKMARERAANAAAALQDGDRAQRYENAPQQGAGAYENTTPGPLYENAPSATDEVYEDVHPPPDDAYEDMQPQTGEVYENAQPLTGETYEDTAPATREPGSPLPELPPEDTPQETAKTAPESGAAEPVYATVLPGTREADSPLPETPGEDARPQQADGDKTDVKALLRQVKGLRGEVRKQVQKLVADGKVSGRAELNRLINEKTAHWVVNNRAEQWYLEGLAEARKAGAPVSKLSNVPPDELFGEIEELIQSHDGVFAYDDIKSAARETVRAYVYSAAAGDTLLLQELKGVRAEVQAEMKQTLAGGEVSGRAPLISLTNEKTAAWVQNNRIGQWYMEGLDRAGLSAPRQGTVPQDLVGLIMDAIEQHDGLYNYEDVKSGSRKIINDYLQAAPARR